MAESPTLQQTSATGTASTWRPCPPGIRFGERRRSAESCGGVTRQPSPATECRQAPQHLPPQRRASTSKLKCLGGCGTTAWRQSVQSTGTLTSALPPRRSSPRHPHRRETAARARTGSWRTATAAGASRSPTALAGKWRGDRSGSLALPAQPARAGCRWCQFRLTTQLPRGSKAGRGGRQARLAPLQALADIPSLEGPCLRRPHLRSGRRVRSGTPPALGGSRRPSARQSESRLRGRRCVACPG